MEDTALLRPVALLACLTLGAWPALAQPSPGIGPSAGTSAGPVGASTPAAPAALPGSATLAARGQASIPLGVTIVVKSVVRGEDAVTVNLVASFDSRVTNSVMLADAPSFLLFGEEQRLSLRQPTGNRDLRIRNGQSMEGSLVFPGQLPPEVREMTLVFNEGRAPDNTSAPGVTVRIALPQSP